MCILKPQLYKWVAAILQTEWTYWVTGQYCTSWLELASFRGSRLGTGSKPKPDDGLDGDLRCRHTPPSAHRKPVIFAHSLIWSCNTHICPIRHMPVKKRKWMWRYQQSCSDEMQLSETKLIFLNLYSSTNIHTYTCVTMSKCDWECVPTQSKVIITIQG